MQVKFSDIIIKGQCYLVAGEFDLLENKINVIVGKNGIGKSLLLSYIHAHKSLETTIVSQKSDELIPSLTIEENITLTIERSENELQQIRKLLVDFGLDYLLDARPHKLSGGEKRIVAIIRGILSKAPLLLIDEPTNDLDYLKVNQLLKLLKRCCEHKTLLIVTHDDRLRTIADSLYKIERQALVPYEIDVSDMLDETNDVTVQETVSSRKSIRENRAILNKFNELKQYLKSAVSERVMFLLLKSKHYPNKIQKIFSYHLCMPLFILTMGIFMHFTFQDANRFFVEQLENINPHQVDIMSPVTARINNLGYALPISFVRLIQEEDIPTRRELEAYVDRVLHLPLSFTLDTLESDDFYIFPLEYFIKEEGRFLQLLEIYSSDILGNESGMIYVDTSAFFIDRFLNYEEESIPLEPLLYEKAVDILHERYVDERVSLYLVYVVLVLNEEFDFFDLLGSGLLEDFSERNYWIKSNETIFIINQVRMLFALRTLRNQWFFIAGGLFLANILYCLLYLGVNRKKITILRNYGFNYLEIKAKILKKFGSKYLVLLTIIFLVTMNILLARETAFSRSIIGYFPGGLSVVALLCSYMLGRIIIHFYIVRLFHWKAR